MTKWIGGADDNLYNPATPGVAEASKSVVLDANKHINEAYIGTAANYTKFETDGTLVMHGDAMVWDDMMVPSHALKTGANAPTFGTWLNGLYVYWFPTAENPVKEAFFALQMSHSWAATAIHPHVHWVPKTNGAAGATVLWTLEYTWADIGQVFPATQTCTVTDKYPDETLVANKHYLYELTVITPRATTPTQNGLSSMLMCRLSRNTITDTYADDAGLLQIDFHYEKNTLGSRQELLK